jgi:hypothetical protein
LPFRDGWNIDTISIGRMSSEFERFKTVKNNVKTYSYEEPSRRVPEAFCDLYDFNPAVGMKRSGKYRQYFARI